MPNLPLFEGRQEAGEVGDGICRTVIEVDSIGRYACVLKETALG